MIKLTLPYPPAVNNLYLTVMSKGRPIRVPSSRAKQFKSEVTRICRDAMLTPLLGNVRIDINVFRPRRIGDLDGTFKVVFDSIKGFAFADDKQITEIYAKRYDDPKKPRVELEITPLGLC